MSRLIVKQLPKHVTDDQFKKFFVDAGFPPTDAKLLRTDRGTTRKFGFVGFRTEQEANEALKYFNNTYFDTSKIIVEKARPPGDPNLPRPWSKYSEGSSAFGQRQKRMEDIKKKKELQQAKKRGDSNKKEKKGDDKKSAPNFETDEGYEQFLKTTQSRQSAKGIKIWQNDFDDQGQPNQNVTDKKTNKSNKFNDSDSEDDDLYSDLPSHVPQSESQKQPFTVEDAVKKTKENKVKKDTFIPGNDSSDSDDEGSGKEAAGEHSEKKESKATSNNTNNSNNKEEGVKEGAMEEDSDAMQTDQEAGNTGRIFVRNLAFTTTEEQLRELFSPFGNIVEVHVPRNKSNGKSIGIAFVQFDNIQSSISSISRLDGQIFQGRIIHLLPAEANQKSENGLKFGNSDSPFGEVKQRKQILNQKIDKGNFNSLFLRTDVVMEALSQQSGVSKSDIINPLENDLAKNDSNEADGSNPTTNSLATRVAIAESKLIKDTKDFFINRGFDFDKLSTIPDNGKIDRSDRVIIVKNIPFSTTEKDLEEMFGLYGKLSEIILPSFKSIAIIIYELINDAKVAYRKLCFKKFHGTPLYLEFAPKVIITKDSFLKEFKPEVKAAVVEPKPDLKKIKAMVEQEMIKEKTARNNGEQQPTSSYSTVAASLYPVENKIIYVKNLDFKTTEEELRSVIEKELPVKSVTFAKKTANNGTKLSMGFGFLEFHSHTDAVNCLKQFQSTTINGRAILLSFADTSIQKAEKEKERQSLKRKRSEMEANEEGDITRRILVKNLAFEVTIKDLRELFEAWGEVKGVRIPKGATGRGRGFGFVDFGSKEEAKRAMVGLKAARLYGRHLILEYSAPEEDSLGKPKRPHTFEEALKQ